MRACEVPASTTTPTVDTPTGGPAYAPHLRWVQSKLEFVEAIHIDWTVSRVWGQTFIPIHLILRLHGAQWSQDAGRQPVWVGGWVSFLPKLLPSVPPTLSPSQRKWMSSQLPGSLANFGNCKGIFFGTFFWPCVMISVPNQYRTQAAAVRATSHGGLPWYLLERSSLWRKSQSLSCFPEEAYPVKISWIDNLLVTS